MVSIKSVVSAALLATLAAAQAPVTNFSSSDISSLASSTTNPNSATKLAWCTSQRTTCSTLCAGSASNNTCDSTSLAFTCTCSSNSSSPALQYFRNSMISNECNTLLGNCLAAHANDLSGQDNCKSTYICGNATDTQASAAAGAGGAAQTSGASSSSAAASTTGSSTAASASSASSHAGAAALANYGEFAPPMFIMMMLGAIATFL